ncbi:nucleophile aminohydrolase [Dunaliella salina]|uniref:Glutathione hydrolase n=1 Tax=Dunaliella salina TaxID=3046 RepID=A0ABQ7H153_DUNSA|nr:nucleophile aminohydrolase [Dunaliella salina]|eukprot:KAF5840576.1 nucleophile aminohydrolase [Dunaliella salina]
MNPTHSFHVDGPVPKKGGAVPAAPGSGLLTFNRGEGQEATALIHPNTTVTRYQGRDWRKISIGVSIGVFLAILIAVAVAFHTEHPEHGILGPSGQTQEHNTQTPPEPELNKDYLGHPRALSTQLGGGMVAADHWICSATGRDVLKEGGHAVDAAVATALCLGVLSPYSSGVGGGLMMVIKSGVNETYEVINARELAPAAASKDMFKGMSAEASQDGGLAIAVPIELKGLELAWSRYGRLPWQRLVQPAAALARNGYRAYPQLVRVLSQPEVLSRVKRFPSLAEIFLKQEPVADAGSKNASNPSSKDGGDAGSKDGGDAGSDANEQGVPMDWRPPRFGEHCCKQTKLADTLDAIGQHGVQWLYGSAERLSTLAQEIQAAGGIITEADLVFAQPLVEDVLHVQVEAMKHAFGARLALGDPGTLERPYADIKAAMDALLDPYFAEGLRRMVEKGSSVLDVHQYGGKLNPLEATPDDKGTTHLSVVDGEGNAVALTSTLNTEFGSCVVSPSTGIILNNQMDDFSRPDMPNSYGLQPSEANYIAGGKRPLSSMSPTIVTEAGQLRIVAGGSGGPRILSSTLQTLARYLLQRQEPLAAVSQPRVHHQLLPNTLKYEDFAYGSHLQFSVPNTTLEYLASKGNAFEAQATPGGTRYNLGVNQAIFVDLSRGVLTGVSDARKGGSPAACNAKPRSTSSQEPRSPPAAKQGRKLKVTRS